MQGFTPKVVVIELTPLYIFLLAIMYMVSKNKA